MTRQTDLPVVITYEETREGYGEAFKQLMEVLDAHVMSAYDDPPPGVNPNGFMQITTILHRAVREAGEFLLEQADQYSLDTAFKDLIASLSGPLKSAKLQVSYRDGVLIVESLPEEG